MKILWFSNCDLSITCASTGSWLYAMSGALVRNGVEICNVTEGKVKQLSRIDSNGIVQYIVPFSKLKKGQPAQSIIKLLQNIEEYEKPDLIHIWGIENYWGILTARGFFRTPLILEIQGIKGSCARVFYANLSFFDCIKCTRLKEVISFKRSIMYEKSQFARWAYYEREMLLKHNYISTQSEWTRAQIAPFIDRNASILCSRIAIRGEYFTGQWVGMESRCILTISSGPIPYKGIHDIIKALPTIIKKHPEAKLKIIGNFGHNAPVWRRSGYTKFIQGMIRNYGLDDRVIFTGSLNAQEIVSEMEKAGVMVISSYVESYCLAMAEAMAVGLPCVATYAGALPELGEEGKNALFYCPGDYEVLSSKICTIFDDKTIATILSHNSKEKAVARNNEETVVEHQFELYNYVLKEQKNKENI